MRAWTAMVATALATTWFAADARADEQPVVADRFAAVREEIVAGKLEAARAALSAIADTPAERAIGVELQFVLDTWIAQGGPPRQEGGVAAAPPAEWEPALADARDLLLRGSYSAASFRLRALADSAPNEVRRAVASELGRVAASLAARTREPAPKPPPVAAPEKPATTEKTAEPETRWYGWQTLLADSASTTLMALGVPTQSGVPAVIGFVGYLVAPPIIHAAHSRPLAALADVGLRVGLPVIFGIVGNALCKTPDSDLGCAPQVAVGVLLGMVTAVVVDGAALSFETVTPMQSGAVRVAPTGLVW